ncbi:AAA family ATPase [Candidatus Woesearchaeota archaeon]|nr:MAG: AAA family ATPase [Candidatus Woesearchaeota archaeon]
MRNQSASREEEAMFSYSLSLSDLEEENKILKETVNQLRSELNRLKSPALLIAEFVKYVNEHAIIKVSNGNQFYVEIASNVKNLSPGDSVLVEQKNLTIVDKIRSPKKFNVESFVIVEKPKLSWKDIGGLAAQSEELKEVIELPLLKPELFRKVGIVPPKGVLLHGPPGTGKTLLAKAVAASTKSTFIEVVGSELVQKFIGEGAKLVKEIFQLAREKAPSIVFIDEIDALAAKRVDVGTSGEREVQRTFMQLLAEIDGFKNLGNVKVIGCTNRLDILDPAITRPGRLDRLIEVGTPDLEGVKEIFKIHAKNMRFKKNIDFKKVFSRLKGHSGAEIKAVVTEAGYFAIRNRRTVIAESDLLKAIQKVKREESAESSDYRRMFG